MKVDLSVVLDAIVMADDNFTCFLDLETGESVMLADELVTGLDNAGLADQIDENPERYRRLPTKYEIHEYEIMEEFVWSLPEGRRRDRLKRAICGRGAFRRFKDTVYDLELEDQWFRFQEQAYRKIAIEWCRDEGLAYTVPETER